MAFVKLIAAILVAAFALGLGAEASRDLFDISRKMKRSMEKLSEQDQADPEKAYSFAKEYTNGLDESDALAARELIAAWDRVLHKPDQCDDSSLSLVGTIGECMPMSSNATKTLNEATEKYARECLTADRIMKAIKSTVIPCSKKRCFKNRIETFMDDKFMDDYWTHHKGPKFVAAILSRFAPDAIINAIVRVDKVNNLWRIEDADSYLKSKLYKPCAKYWMAYSGVMGEISSASIFLEGGYRKLVSLVDGDTQKVFFRYQLCKQIDMQDEYEERSNARYVSACLRG